MPGRKIGLGKRKVHMVYVKEGDKGIRLIGCFGQEDQAYEVGKQWAKWGYFWCLVVLPLNQELDPGVNITDLKWSTLGASPRKLA